MPLLLKQNQKKQKELYLRCLSSVCIPSSLLKYYYVHYEYNRVDRLLYRKSLKNTMKKWEIKNAGDFERTLRFLLEEGTRQEYDRVYRELTSRPFVARKNFLEYIESSVSVEEDENNILLAGGFKFHIYKELLSTDPHYARLYITNYGLHILPNKGIVAFDIAWSIYLCRVGQVLGYITKEWAMKFMEKAVQLATENYSNWHDYFQGYIIGCFFNRSIETYQALLTEKHTVHTGNYMFEMFKRNSSPLYKLPWRNGLFNKPQQG